MKTITRSLQNFSKVLTLAAVAIGFTVMPFAPALTPVNTAEAASGTIFSDGFEDGSQFSNWTSHGNPFWTQNGSNPHEGQKKAEAHGNESGGDKTLLKEISTEGHEDIELSFWYRYEDLDSTSSLDTLTVEWYDGSSWGELVKFEGVDGDADDVDDWTEWSDSLPAGADDNADFKLRFVANLSHGNDKFFLDDVNLEGKEISSCDPQHDTGDSSDPIENLDTDEYFDSIQDAIDDCDTDDGDVIEVDAGTYTEAVDVHKSLTINGPNAGTPGHDDGARGTEAIIDAPNGTTNLIKIQPSATEVTIDGFTLQGADRRGIFVGHYNNAPEKTTIQNNIIKDIGDSSTSYETHGILVEQGADESLIKGNLIQNIDDGNSGNAVGLSMVSQNPDGLDEVTVDDNHIKDIKADTKAKGIEMSGKVTNTTIKNNIIDNIGDGTEKPRGLAMIEHDIDGDSGTPKVGPTSFEIFGNTFDNINSDMSGGSAVEGPATVFIGGYSDLGAEHSMYYNNFMDGIVRNMASTELFAEENYWDDSSGPSHEGPGGGTIVSTNVDFSPWLCNEYTGQSNPETSENGSCGDPDDQQDDIEPNECVTPDTKGDDDDEEIGESSGEDEKTVQEVLDDEGYSIDVDDDQKNYQVFNQNKDSTTFEYEILASHPEQSSYDAELGYYEAGATSTFQSLTGNSGTTTVSDDIGFAIETGPPGNRYVVASENSENGGDDQVIVYETNNPNEYILAFEDLLGEGGDYDYNDLIVRIEFTGCEDDEPQEPEVCSAEGEVIEYTEDAVQDNEEPVDSDRRDVAGVENGPADYQNPNGKEGNSWSTDDFFSLGIGGELEYKFTNKVAFDGPGDDIAIYEITGGPEGEQTDEKVGVYVSDDGDDWVSMGTSTGDITIDIDGTGLPFVKYVKLADDSAGIQGNNGDGYDVDAIVILDDSCGDEPDLGTGSIEITKYICDPGTDVSRSNNGPDGSVPDSCDPLSGVEVGYVYQADKFDNSSPWPGTNEGDDLDATAVTDDGKVVFDGLETNGRYNIAEADGEGQAAGDDDVLALYCEDDNGGGDDNLDYTILGEEGETDKCVIYNERDEEEIVAQSCDGGDMLYLATDSGIDDNGTLFSVNTDDGSRNALQNYSNDFYPVLADYNDNLYTIDRDGDQLVTLDGDGDTSDVGNATIGNTPVAMDADASGTLFVLTGESDDALYTVDLTDSTPTEDRKGGVDLGSENGDLEISGGDLVVSDAGGGDLIYINGDGEVFSIDLSGNTPNRGGIATEIDELSNPGQITSLTVKDGTFYALDRVHKGDSNLGRLHEFTVSESGISEVSGSPLTDVGPYQAGDATCAAAPEDEIDNTIDGYKFNDENGNHEWDDEEEGLAEWTIALRPIGMEPVDTIELGAGDIDGEDTVTLDSEKTYVIEVDGYWENTGQIPRLVDAEYFSDDGWDTHTDMADEPNRGERQLDVVIDDQNVDWGSYNNDHLYKTIVEGSGESVNIRVYDEDNAINPPDWYNDNEGSVTVRIYDVTDYTTQTDGEGYYSFEVEPGEYQVVEMNQDGWTQTAPSGPSYCHVDATQSDASCDFGNQFEEGERPFEPAGSISGSKWEPGAGEGGAVAGWQINLYEWGEGQSEPFMSTTTNNDGQYSFEDVPYGTYLVCEENQSGWNQAHPGSITEGNPSCDNGTIGYYVDIGPENDDSYENYFENEQTPPQISLFGGGGGGDQANRRGGNDDNGRTLGVKDEGEVLGEQSGQCEPYLNDYMRRGIDNDPFEVLKLQLFLNAWMGADLALTQVYDRATEAAVRAFQARYADDVLKPWNISEPTGNVYITTMAKINGLLCERLTDDPLPPLVPFSRGPGK